MNILAICSALNNSYFAYKYEDKIYSEIIKSDKNYHSLYLIQNIKNALEDKNIDIKNFDAFSVNCGPGSFTGIRVALTIAKIIAGELKKPLIPLNTAEILLCAYDGEYLFMDARRDMYFKCDKNNIKLVRKELLKENMADFENKKIICDKRCLELFGNAVCFEETEKDLGKIMINLAEEKYKKEDKNNFNYINTKANYIQTPPVF